MNKRASWPKISIIISHYNKARYLNQAISSAISQSVPPKEVIVVDDCSCDKEKEKAKKICDSHGVSLILRKRNGGPSVARNDGIRASKGEWIQILDADDFLTRQSFERRLEALTHKPETLWIAGQYAKVKWFVSPKSLESRFLKHLPPFKLKIEPVIEPHKVREGDPWVVKWPHQAILFRRILFQKYGLYDEMIRMGQDKEIRWRFWYASKTIPAKVEDIVYIYRQGHGPRLTDKANNPERVRIRGIMMDNIERRKNEGLRPENTPFL